MLILGEEKAAAINKALKEINDGMAEGTGFPQKQVKSRHRAIFETNVQIVQHTHEALFRHLAMLRTNVLHFNGTAQEKPGCVTNEFTEQIE